MWNAVLCRWLIRHHPGWWRRRYEDEVLALIESDRPGRHATVDLARSCVRTWFECHSTNPQAHPTGPSWLVAARLLVQLPLVLAAVLVMLSCGVAVALALLFQSAGPLLTSGFLPAAAPIAASTALMLFVATRRRWACQPLRITLASIVAALVTMAAVVAAAAASDPYPAGALQGLSTSRVAHVRTVLQLSAAYAVTAGLVVRMVFRGIPWGRCVVNCVHVEGRHRGPR